MKKIVIGFILTLFFVGTANAWYLELGPTYTGAYGSQAQNVIFQSDTDPAGSINLNGMSLAVTWDSGASPVTSPYAVTVPTIMTGRTTLWTNPGLAYGVSGNVIYNAVGAEPFATIGSFFPADGTVLLTYGWLANPGNTAFTSYLLMGVETVGIDANQTSVAWAISPDGKRIGPSSGPVIPIPGAVYLLASGLLGLIGLRRRSR